MTIEEKRKEIADIDRVLLDYFQKRMKAVKEIAKIKKSAGLPIRDTAYENEKLKSLMLMVADEYKEYAMSFIMNLMKLSREFQTKD